MAILTRRTALTVAAAGAAGAIYPFGVEPQWLDVSINPVHLPMAGRVRVLHLSDLHASWAVPNVLIERAINSGLQTDPDLVCLTGDFITHRYDFDPLHLADLLKRLTATRPVFAVLGNHDGGRWAREHKGYADHVVVERVLENAGIELLHNRCRALAIRDVEISLVGVGDLWANELNAERAFREVKRKGPVLLLSHNPDSKDILSRFEWDLMLSGHTHGGQVMIPFEGPRYAPVRDKRFVKGLHQWDGRQIYITRGVGSIGSVRFLSRPEVSVLDLFGPDQRLPASHSPQVERLRAGQLFETENAQRTSPA